MWADFRTAPDRHFYIKEIARLHDGRFVVPMKWLSKLELDSTTEETYADVHFVEQDPHGYHIVHTETVERIQAKDFAVNYPELQRQGLEFRFDGEYLPKWQIRG